MNILHIIDVEVEIFLTVWCMCFISAVVARVLCEVCQCLLVGDVLKALEMLRRLQALQWVLAKGMTWANGWDRRDIAAVALLRRPHLLTQRCAEAEPGRLAHGKRMRTQRQKNRWDEFMDSVSYAGGATSAHYVHKSVMLADNHTNVVMSVAHLMHALRQEGILVLASMKRGTVRLELSSVGASVDVSFVQGNARVCVCPMLVAAFPHGLCGIAPMNRAESEQYLERVVERSVAAAISLASAYWGSAILEVLALQALQMKSAQATYSVLACVSEGKALVLEVVAASSGAARIRLEWISTSHAVSLSAEVRGPPHRSLHLPDVSRVMPHHPHEQGTLLEVSLVSICRFVFQ